MFAGSGRSRAPEAKMAAKSRHHDVEAAGHEDEDIVDDDEYISTSSTDDEDDIHGRASQKSVRVRGMKSKIVRKFQRKASEKDPHLQKNKLRHRTIMKPISIPRIFLLLHRFHFIMIWECLMSFMILVMYLVTTYCAVFSYYDSYTWTFLNSSEILFVFDVCLRLSAEVWRHYSKVPCQVFVIQYTLWQFMRDLIAMFPISPLYIAIVGSNSINLLNYLFVIRFNRFIRIVRAHELFAKMKIEKRGDDRLINIVEYLYRYILLAHFFACCAYALNKVFYVDWMLARASLRVDNDSTATWLYLRKYNALFNQTSIASKPEPYDLYLLSMDFIVAIFTTVGYGDLYPLHYSDTMLTIFVIIIGSIIVQGTLNNLITEFHLEHDISRFDLFFRLRGIRKYMRSIDAPPIYMDRTVEYYQALWNYREGILDVNLADIPISMQQELMYDICEEMLFKSPLFRDLEENFLLAISRIVKIDLYIPDMIVQREGDYATSMQYVIQGELRVRGKMDPDNCALILRPGSIIGEVSLLFSFPSLTTIETRTVCQIMSIRKDEFRTFMKHYPSEMTEIRRRIRDRFSCLFHHYKIVGHKSVSWVQHKEIGELGFDINPLNFPMKLKSTSGFNPEVKEDIRDDSVGTYIVSMKNFCPQKSKDHFACYIHCNIENIFSAGEPWVVGWNVFILIFATVFGFAMPYCTTFDDPSSRSDSFYCEIFHSYYYISFPVHLVDILVEIYVATPSKGLFYRARDGIRVCIRKVYFWIDVLAIIPIGPITGKLSLGTGVRSIFKCAKVFRFLCHLDNVFPLQIFAVRMVKAFLLIVYCVHVIACVLFAVVCPTGIKKHCVQNTWLSSYYRNADYPPLRGTLQEEVLRERAPYLLSLWFSAATVTSAGFGDFTPQNRTEIFLCLMFMVGGVFFVAYIIGGLAAALTCGIRPKLVFQQKISSIRIFLQHHNLSGRIQDRVIEHYVLQDKLIDGIIVPGGSKHLLYDAPRFIAEDTLFWEVETYLAGVPLFTKCDRVILTRMAKLMKRYLLPPDLTFVDRGEVRRSMYIISKGSVGLLTTEGEETTILEATGHFGIRDLLFGEPHEFFIKSKSYVLLYAIDFQNFVDSFEGYDEEMMELLYQEKMRISKRIHDLVFIRGMNTHLYEKSKEKPVKIGSFVILPWRKNMNFPYCTNEEYHQIYRNIPRLSWLYRLTLMPITIHPAGVFAKVWNSLIAAAAIISFVFCFVELFIQARPPPHRHVQICLDILSWTNIYLKLHWCYFDDNSLLISHPAKTAYNYMFNGLFVYDILFVNPFEFFLVVRGAVNMYGYGLAANWYTKLRMNRCLQVYRFPELFRIVHSLFTHRTWLLVLFYMLVLYWVTSTLGCIAIYLACPGFPRIWKSGDEHRMPACLKGSWIFKDIVQIDYTSMAQRQIIGIYYVLQAVLTVGFGDTVHINFTEILFLIPVMLIGTSRFILMQVVIADITAAEVDTNENRALFLEDRRCLLSCLRKENAPNKVLNTVDHHLDFVWEESRGCQPRELFVDLHPSLASDVFEEFVGVTLTNVPLFQNFSTQVLRSMSKLLKKQYFLKGERISRSGNLEYEMFLIVEGRVYMMDEEDNYLATLKKNQFFGEISMLYGRPRKHSAIAGTKVEVFVLNADDFAELIEKYPTVKEEILNALKKEKKEIWQKDFTRKMRSDPENWERKAKALNIEIHRMIRSREVKIVRSSEHREISNVAKFKFSRWVVGYGPENYQLPFLYFGRPSYEKIRFKLLIHPNCLFWRMLRRLVLIIYYVSVMLTLYLVFFTNHSRPEIKAADTVTTFVTHLSQYVEYCVCIYIVLKFFVPFEIGYGNYCKEWCKIVFRYLTDPLQFPLDLIGAIPVGYLMELFPRGTQYDEYLVFIQFVRLIPFYGAMVENTNSLRVNPLVHKLTVALSVFLLVGHSLACILYNAAVPEEVILDPSWVRRVEDSFEGIPEEARVPLRYPSMWYLRSIYFMLTIMTTCGFGDNLPQNFQEYALVCATMLFGAIGTAIVLGNFSAGLAALQQAKREYFYKINTNVKHLTSIGLSGNKGKLLLAYYIALWDVGRGQPYHKAAAILPLTMQFDCCAVLFGEAIMKCSFFGETTDDTFIRNIAIRMIHSVYLPGINIVSQGEPGNSVYIVYKGVVCSYIANESDKVPEFRHKFTKYECFGRSSCLFRNMMHGKTYRAETKVEMLQIEQTDVIHVARHYPIWKDYLERLIHKRFQHTSHLRKHIFAQDSAKEPQKV